MSLLENLQVFFGFEDLTASNQTIYDYYFFFLKTDAESAFNS